MSKTLSTTKSVFRILGIKVCEFTSDYLWREFTGDTEEIRDDIILHERILKNREKKRYEDDAD